jgi:4-aminobutyrate aminotransferase-like enzyme
MSSKGEIKLNLEKSKKLWNEYEDNVIKITDFIEPVFKTGEGSYVLDVDNNKYLDLNAGQFCLGFGHSYKPFLKEINKQMTEIYHTNTLSMTEVVMKSLKALGSIAADNLNKGILLSTGAEANECAIRYAKYVSGKNKVMGLDKGYHGLTLATQSISSGGKWANPCVEGSISVKTPDYLHRSENKNKKNYIYECINDIKEKLSRNKGEVAALVIEPIIAVGGMIYPPKEYFQKIRELCDKFDVLLIIDECQTGMGRTGKWFAYEHYGIKPDILVSGKSAGLGIPVSAVVFDDKLVEKIENGIMHFSSHQNDPLAAAALLFMIEEMKDKELLTEINKKGNYCLKKLKKLSNESNWLKNPRGKGLMLAFDLPFDKYNKNINPGHELMEIMMKNGVLIQAIRQGKTFRVLPNYFISYKEIDFFIEVLKKSLNELDEMMT